MGFATPSRRLLRPRTRPSPSLGPAVLSGIIVPGRRCVLAARRLVEQSQQLFDADVLMGEAEAAIAALRETMQRAAGA